MFAAAAVEIVIFNCLLFEVVITSRKLPVLKSLSSVFHPTGANHCTDRVKFRSLLRPKKFGLNWPIFGDFRSEKPKKSLTLQLICQAGANPSTDITEIHRVYAQL